jgi:GTP-binding protein
VERTRVLVHVVDASGREGRDPVEDFHVVNRELAAYDPNLASRPTVVAANKIDLPGARENVARLAEALGARHEVYGVSAVTGEGVDRLIRRVYQILESTPVTLLHVPELRREEPDQVTFTVVRDGEDFLVKGNAVERRVAMTDLSNPEAVHYLQNWLIRIGVEDALRAEGIRPGATVRIGDFEFTYAENATS